MNIRDRACLVLGDCRKLEDLGRSERISREGGAWCLIHMDCAAAWHATDALFKHQQVISVDAHTNIVAFNFAFR